MLISVRGETLQDGKTYTTDHVVQDFKIIVRSMAGVGEGDILNLLQSKYEVIRVETGTTKTYVR